MDYTEVLDYVKDRTLLDPKTGCWLWNSDTQEAYPKMYISGKQYYIHRVLALGEKHLTNGFSVHHTCNNKKCLNPDHLGLFTYKENSQEYQKTNNRYCLDTERGKELDNTIQLFMKERGIDKKAQAIKELVNLGLNYYFFVNQ